MIPKPETREQALTNAKVAAEKAHAHAVGNRPYPAQSWSMVADAWSRIACQLPDIRLMADDEETVTLAEVTTPRSGADLARQMRDSGLAEGLPSAQRILNDLTEDELDTIAALRAGTIKVVMTPGSGVDPGVTQSEDTLDTVRRILVTHFDTSNEDVTDVISDMQNAGILFRERASDKTKSERWDDEARLVGVVAAGVPMRAEMVQALRSFTSYLMGVVEENRLMMSVEDFVKHGRTNFVLQRADDFIRLIIDE